MSSIPHGIMGWAKLIAVVAISVAVIWRIPQLRALVTGS